MKAAQCLLASRVRGALYDIEREIKGLSPDERLRIRRLRARPAADLLHVWLMANRQKLPEGGATAKAMDYSLKRWTVLTRYIDDGELSIDNNRVENLIRPIALGRKNWLFADSLRAGQRAAAIMSLLHTARLNGHDPYQYSRMCWSDRRHSRTAAFESCCPIVGHLTALPDRASAAGQDDLAGRVRLPAWMRRKIAMASRSMSVLSVLESAIALQVLNVKPGVLG